MEEELIGKEEINNWLWVCLPSNWTLEKADILATKIYNLLQKDGIEISKAD